MAPARTSADSSENEDKSAPLASSLAGLPVRGDADKQQQQNGQADPSKPQSGQLKDFLDLAVRRSPSLTRPPDTLAHTALQTTNKADGSPDVSAVGLTHRPRPWKIFADPTVRRAATRGQATRIRETEGSSEEGL